jgi:hypothetical protein
MRAEAPGAPGRLAQALAVWNDSEVLHFRTLRRAIGFIALALPFVLVIGENLRDLVFPSGSAAGGSLIELSISAYFHTGMRDVFVGSLCAIAIFLLCYKGPQRIDNVIANIAGSCLLLVALFPTPEPSREATDSGAPAPDSATLFSGPTTPDPAFVGWIHFGSATIFFVLLAVMSLFLFTRTHPHLPMTPEKRQRNAIYRACGIAILVAVLAIALAKLLLDEPAEVRTSYVFWFESVAVVAFGFSWLTKGEMVRCDPTGTRSGVPRREIGGTAAAGPGS